MNFQRTVELVDRLLNKVAPGVSLGNVTEETFEATLGAMLDVYDRLGGVKPPASDRSGDPISMSLASPRKRRIASHHAKRLSGFVRLLTDSGISADAAFRQAERLNIGGVSNDR